MSWLSEFFRKDSVKTILNLGLQILKLFLGKVASELQKVVQEEVSKAEASGKTGTEKYEIAYKAIKARLPQIKESLINFAIEQSVLALMAAKR